MTNWQRDLQRIRYFKIGYNPLKWTQNKILFQEVDNFFRKDTIKGYVHDEAAAILGGVSEMQGCLQMQHQSR
ncbi:hypothetical protein [Flavobacterium sp. 140616W15]|uniref:hypothetical protein n=1 Tax=Flavobacterium sp. 140616W15 TaxID=2478552 RepID=UPI000F0C5B88|nr:hypothetical protein [Flavobacterium sp. 140616W15]AYN02746.1 hypothetical protein EAG11_00065 [Flavobacterium sp. 140616W15]